MDVDGKVGLKDAPDELLTKARARANGDQGPRGPFRDPRHGSQQRAGRGILDDPTLLLPLPVVEVLVGERFSRLDPTAQHAMESLAVYARPVTPAAVDYLLQPHFPGMKDRHRSWDVW